MTESEAERVLVIEDDPDARDGLRDVLTLDGYQIETAAALGEALDRSDLHAFALIVLDRKLPDDPQETALPLLKQRAREAAIAVVTGFDDLNGAVSAIRHGASEYLLKPVDGELARLRLGSLIQRRRAERARREADEMLRTIINVSPLAIATLDQGGKVLAWNPSAEHLFGWPSEQVVGRRIPIIPADQANAFDGTPPELDGSSRQELEVQRRHLDGTLLDVALWTAPFHKGDSQLNRAVCFYVDISRRKRAERRLLRSQRLAAIQETVNGLAHECRNALQRGYACLEMLQIELEEESAALELLERLQQSHHDLHRLYEEVVAYASPIRLQCKSCDLGALYREVWDQLESRREHKTIEFRDGADGVDLHCFVDRSAVGRAFRQILQNSISAIPESGQVFVTAQECALNREPALRLVFRDDGPGFDVKQRARVFEPFFTTKTKGLGLGMSVAQGIIEAHGGRIEIGEPGPGAEVIVLLPREAN